MGKAFITTHRSPRELTVTKVKLDIITAEQEEETCSTEASVSPWAKPGKELYVRVVHGNDGPGNIVSKRVFSQEQTLNECLTRDPSLCREKDSLMAAKKLPGVRGLKKLPKVGLSPLLGKGKKFNTCAIVGNAVT